MAKKGNKVLIKYIKKYLPFIILSTLLSVISVWLNLYFPEIIGDLVDETVGPDLNFHDIHIDPNYIIDKFTFVLIILLLSSVFGGLNKITSSYIGTNVVYGIRQDLYEALQKQSYGFYDKNRTGDIISKATHDVSVSRQFLANQLAAFFRDIVTLIIIIYKVTKINAQLSGVFILIIPILWVTMIIYRKKMYKNYMSMSRRRGRLTSTINENITGFRVVKSFAREKHELEKYRKSNKELYDANLKMSRITSIYGPFQSLIINSSAVLLFAWGALKVLDGTMQAGDVIEFYAYFIILMSPIRSIINIFFQFSNVQGSLDRINTILQNKVEIEEPKDPIYLKDVKGQIEFKNVRFSYDENEVLKGLNLNVKAGESIAIIGSTGSGKSTFINMIPRFYDPTKGKITIDGIDIKDVNIESYRRKIGMVSQDIFLFSRSIEENICYGLEEEVPREEIEQVAKIASIHNFITSLPDGYDTKVGERGQTMSGGQKQRVAIARALLLKPKIIILDDSLSAVDIDTESQIQNALENLFSGITTFIITQRISTIKNCDRIMVLERGAIKELGTHDDLYHLGGIYTKIYNTMYKASTKRAERLEKPSPIVSNFNFEELGIEFREDMITLEKIYKDQSQPEEVEALMETIKKRQFEADRKLLRKKRQNYMEILIELLLKSKQHQVSFDKLEKKFLISNEVLEQELAKRISVWKRVLPITINEEERIISIEDFENFKIETNKLLEIWKHQKEGELLKEEIHQDRRHLRDHREHIIEESLELLTEKETLTFKELASRFDVNVDALEKQLKRWDWKIKSPIEFTEESVTIKDMEEFLIAKEELYKSWDESEKIKEKQEKEMIKELERKEKEKEKLEKRKFKEIDKIEKEKLKEMDKLEKEKLKEMNKLEKQVKKDKTSGGGEE